HEVTDAYPVPTGNLWSELIRLDHVRLAFLIRIEFHIIREIFRLSNPELLAVWRSPAWSADTKSPHSPPHFETSRYRAVCAASPYESARVDSSCGSRSPATRESPPSGTLRSCQNR